MKQKLAIIASVLLVVLATAPDAWAQWEKTNVPTSGRCFATIGSNLFVGTESSGIFCSTDSGANWIPVNTGLPNVYISSLFANGTYLFAGTGGPGSFSVDSGAFRSIDSGKSWKSVNSGLSNKNIRSLTISGTNIFAGTWGSGVFISTDSGNNWRPENSGFVDTLDYYVDAIFVDGTNMFAGTGKGIFISTNNGSSWAPSWLSGDGVNALSRMGPNMLAGLAIGGIYRLRNNGSSWESTKWTGFNVEAFSVFGSNIYAATQDAEVIRSTDSGGTWSQVDESGLKRTNAFALIVSGRFMFAGTGDGVYRIPLSELLPSSAVQPMSQTERCITAYPNPISQSTTITLSSPESGAAEVTILSLLGSEVKRIFSGEMDAGKHDFSWDASGLPPGMYECVVRINGSAYHTPIVIEK